jgi:hypothetical protein
MGLPRRCEEPMNCGSFFASWSPYTAWRTRRGGGAAVTPRPTLVSAEESFRSGQASPHPCVQRGAETNMMVDGNGGTAPPWWHLELGEQRVARGDDALPRVHRKADGDCQPTQHVSQPTQRVSQPAQRLRCRWHGGPGARTVGEAVGGDEARPAYARCRAVTLVHMENPYRPRWHSASPRSRFDGGSLSGRGPAVRNGGAGPFAPE